MVFGGSAVQGVFYLLNNGAEQRPSRVFIREPGGAKTQPRFEARNGALGWGKNPRNEVAGAAAAPERKLWQLGADFSPTLCSGSRHRRGFVGVAQVALGSVRSWNIWAAISQHGSL